MRGLNILDLEEILGLEIPNKFGKVGDLNRFYGKLISNYRSKKWSEPLNTERLENFKRLKGVEIIATNTETVLYRCAGKLFVNKLFANNWKGKRIL